MTSLDGFTIELRRLYSFERELVSALDGLATDVAVDALDDLDGTGCRQRLRELVETHREETVTHRDRLEDVFEAIGEDPETRPVPELEGWVFDKEQFNNIVLNDELRPLYYLTAAKKLEEIERSAYELALALAEHLEEEGDVSGVVDPLTENAGDERAMLEDLDALSDSESVSELLEATQVSPVDRSELDRDGVNVETIEDLFLYQLQNVYYVERTLADRLEEIGSEADDEGLEEAFDAYAEQARTHVDRLEDVFETVGPRATSSKNRTLEGLLASRAERRELLGEGTDILDLETGVAVERVEIRSYEELLALAERIGYPDDVRDALETTLEEERETLEGLEEAFEDRIEESSAGTVE